MRSAVHLHRKAVSNISRAGLSTKKSVRGESRRAALIGGGGQGVKISVGKVLLLMYDDSKGGRNYVKKTVGFPNSHIGCKLLQ